MSRKTLAKSRKLETVSIRLDAADIRKVKRAARTRGLIRRGRPMVSTALRDLVREALAQEGPATP